MNQNTQNAVLIFTFSPVQGFIEASRRTRDFFTGSYILSWLTFKVMYRLTKEHGINPDDFIYPVLKSQPLYHLFKNESDIDIESLAIANFPNRFVLKVDYDKGKELITQLKDMFREEWKEIANSIFDKFLKDVAMKKRLIEHEIHEDELWDQFELQVENYFTPFISLVKIEGIKEKFMSLFDSSKELKEILKKQGDVSYGYAYDLAERVLGSRKTFRPYKGLIDAFKYKDDKGREILPDGCSVCGERKALAIDWTKLKDNYDFQGDELCGVCLVKRYGYTYFTAELKNKLEKAGISKQRIRMELLGDDILDVDEKEVPNAFKNFPSTREIAGISFKKIVFEKWDKLVEQQLDRYIKSSNRLFREVLNLEKQYKPYRNGSKEADEKLLYLSKLKSFLESKTYPIRFFKYEDIGSSKWIFSTRDAQLFHLEEWKNAIKYLGKLGFKADNEDWKAFFEGPIFKYDENAELKHENSYFAIFYADGDHMGKWLGLKQEIRGEPLTEKFHKGFSQEISKYALIDVPQVVEKEHPGKLVYAGGDDVFAFVHPWDVISILNKLRKKFESRLDKFPTVEGKQPSMSAGVVIGHAKAPLKRLIKNVRKAEKKAKDDFGRSAFVIRVVVRSGSTWDFGGKWEYCYNGKKFDTAEEFNKTIKLLMDDGECIERVKCNLSSNFIYDVRDMLETFEPAEFDEDALRIFESLFKRAFRRKFRCSGNKDENKRALESAINNYLDFIKAMIHTHIEEARKNDSEVNENEIRYKAVENFANMFYVARFIAKEVKI
ncbi:MAG: type III-B CRISPR-associated protein Cas10/Cmr2 [Aquificae bacterium]|nr:type III-B CRISPR-associated protein Cas10/Cmr2 [Aquificota bacterium]